MTKVLMINYKEKKINNWEFISTDKPYNYGSLSVGKKESYDYIIYHPGRKNSIGDYKGLLLGYGKSYVKETNDFNPKLIFISKGANWETITKIGESINSMLEEESLPKNFTDILDGFFYIEMIEMAENGNIRLENDKLKIDNKEINDNSSYTISIKDDGKIEFSVDTDIIKKIKEALKELGKVDNKKKLIKLTHRIAHLWLPLDIDLQGIKEVLSSEFRVPSSEEKKKRAEDYLKDVLKSEKGNAQFYRQKLADIQRIVSSKFRVPSFKLNDPCKDAKPVDCSKEIKKFMEGKEAILDLIEKGKNKENEKEIEKLKKTLLILAGLKNSELGTSNYESNTDSPIFKFMCLLDCKIKKLSNGGSMKNADVNDILNFEPLKDLLSNIKHPKSNIRVPFFHSWSCALDECLCKLREKIQSTHNTDKVKRNFLHAFSHMLFGSSLYDLHDNYTKFEEDYSGILGQKSNLKELIEEGIEKLKNKCIETKKKNPNEEKICEVCEEYINGTCRLKEEIYNKISNRWEK